MFNENCLISIVIPVYNSEQTLEECLQSILALSYINFELIIVNDGSSDSSEAIIQGYAQKDQRIKFITTENGGPASARNTAIAMALGEIVFFTDSDVVVNSDWVEKILSCFVEDEIAAVGGIVKAYSLDTVCERAEQMRYDEVVGTESAYVEALPTCNLAIKRSVLLEIGGFDEGYKHASTEDYDLCYRIRAKGYKIYLDANSYILHKHPVSLYGVVRRAFYHGVEKHKFEIKQKIQHIYRLKSFRGEIGKFLYDIACYLKRERSQEKLISIFYYFVFIFVGRVFGFIKYGVIELFNREHFYER